MNKLSRNSLMGNPERSWKCFEMELKADRASRAEK